MYIHCMVYISRWMLCASADNTQHIKIIRMISRWMLYACADDIILVARERVTTIEYMRVRRTCVFPRMHARILVT